MIKKTIQLVHSRNRAWVAILVASLALIMSGCRDKNNEQSDENGDEILQKRVERKAGERDSSPLSPRFKPTDVIVRVNGHDITKADYDLWFNLRGQIYCLRRGLPLKGRNKELKTFLDNSAFDVFRELIRRELMRQAAEKSGVSASKDRIDRIKAAFMAHIRQPKGSFDSVVKRLGPKFGPALLASVESDAINATYLEKWSTNNLTVVTQKEIDEQKAMTQSTNKEIAELNAASHRKAEEARKEILEKNRSFREVAKERAELCPEQGERWDVVELDELEASDPFTQWLAKAKVGDISHPIDFDDGLAIVGLVSKVKSDSSIHPGQEADMYEVVRILFKAYEPFEVLETDEEWREALLENRKREAVKALGKELDGAAKIEFPNGESLFNRRQHKARNPRNNKAAPKKGQQKGDGAKSPPKKVAGKASPTQKAAPKKPGAAPAAPAAPKPPSAASAPVPSAAPAPGVKKSVESTVPVRSK